MKTEFIMGAIVASLLATGCGSSDNNDDTNTGMTDRFMQMTMAGDIVEVDTMTTLEWIGSAGNGACSPHAAATTQAGDIASAVAHCDTLTFASHTDWRVPTSEENEVFIKGMNDAGLTPFYANPACPRVIGSDGSVATAVNTHNSTPIGGLTSWDALLKLDATNFGVKCVRNQ